jgi:hypothetical protein
MNGRMEDWKNGRLDRSSPSPPIFHPSNLPSFHASNLTIYPFIIMHYFHASAKAPLKPFSFDPGELGPEEVEIKVTHCGAGVFAVNLEAVF